MDWVGTEFWYDEHEFEDMLCECEAGHRWLTGVARCSKRFNSLATPLLYSSFTKNYIQGRKVRLAPFLRAVLRKPELGMLTRRHSLHCSGGMIRDDRLDIKGSGIFDDDDILHCHKIGGPFKIRLSRKK